MMFILKYFVKLLYYLTYIFQLFNINGGCRTADLEFIFLIFYFLKGGCRATRYIFNPR